MDAFFASVEQLDEPRYRNKPVIVGGTGPRGVVAAASYEVRAFGVFSAMPMSRARRLCPQAIVVRGRMARYREVSAQVFGIFNEVTPEVEGLSLDEAFLDVTASLALFGSIETIGSHLRGEILERTGLHASVGMAHNKFLAKLASDLSKPRGFVHVPADAVHDFLDPMPVSKMWGLGKRTLPRIRKLGILTIGQLRRADPDSLRTVLGNRTARFQALARGEDERPVVPRRPDKSMSREVTFDHDIRSPKLLLAELQRQVDSVTGRLRAHGLLARTVQIKVRDNKFKTITRARSLAAPTASREVVYRQARDLLNKWLEDHHQTPVRLLGVGLTGLEKRGESGGELDSASQKALDATLDAIKQRFGQDKAVHGLELARNKESR
jgi:DNA polymerase-4